MNVKHPSRFMTSVMLYPLITLLAGWLLVPFGMSQGTASVPRSSLTVGSDANGLFLKDGDRVLRLSPLDPAVSSLKGLSLKSPGDGKTFEIAVPAGEVVVDFGMLPGTAVKISGPAFVKAVFDITGQSIQWNLESASKPAVWRLSDGAAASMPAGTILNLHYFPNQSYLLSGLGGVEYEGADGKGLKLYSNIPPQRGGPLKEVTDATGQKRLERTSPFTDIKILGELAAPIKVLVGDAPYEVKTGEPILVTTSSGGVIELKINPQTRQLQWDVKSGAFDFVFPEIKGWKGMALPGQRGGLQWGLTQGVVDWTNLTPPQKEPESGFQYVMLRGRSSAAIGPGATFQYAPVKNSVGFATSAVGGKVYYVDGDANAVIPLDSVNRLFGQNIPLDDNRMQAILWWQCDAPFDLRTPQGNSTVPVDNNRRISITGYGEVDVTYSAKGMANLLANEGNYLFRLRILPDWNFRVDEGNMVTFQLDCANRTLVVNAPASNTKPVIASSGTGFSPVLSPGGSLTFVLGTTPGLIDSSGTFVFYNGGTGAGADAGGFGSVPSSPPPDFTSVDQISQPIIIQPPVSVVR